MAKELPDVPAVPLSLERGTRELLSSLRQHVRELRGFQGDPGAKAVTVAAAGSIGGGGGNVIVVPGNPGGGSDAPDLTPPPSPGGVTVNAGIDFLFYQTAVPAFPVGHGYGRTKVYGAKWPASDPDGPTFADAVLIDEFVGTVGSTPTEPATRWCVWLKWVSKDGVESTDPAGGTNGFTATTGNDVTQLLAALNGKLRNEQLDPTSTFRFKANLFTIESASGTPSINPFTVLTVPTMTPAGELLPAGVYMEAVYIKGLEAALARFQTAVITNAMIQNLSATKVTSGVVQVGNYIQSSDYVAGTLGWRLVSGGVCQLPAAYIIGKITADQFDGRGALIRDNTGKVLFGVGNPLSWSDVAPAGRPRILVAASQGYTNVSSPINAGAYLDGVHQRGPFFWGLAWYHPTTLALITYYEFGPGVGSVDAAADLLRDLRVQGTNYLLTVCTSDNPTAVVTTRFIEELLLYGASRGGLGSTSFLSTYRASYALVGRAGLGEGQGVENLSRVSAAYAIASATIMNGQIVGGQKDLKIDAGNVTSFIDNAAINAAQIGSLYVTTMSTGLNGGALSGERLVMALNQLFAYDVNNVDRALFGKLS
jgi:hypothetical protein